MKASKMLVPLLLAFLIFATIPAAKATSDQEVVTVLAAGYCTNCSTGTQAVSYSPGSGKTGAIIVVSESSYGTITVSDNAGNTYLNDYTTPQFASSIGAVSIQSYHHVSGTYSQTITIKTSGSAGTMAWEIYGITPNIVYDATANIGLTTCGWSGGPACSHTQDIHTQDVSICNCYFDWVFVGGILASPGYSTGQGYDSYFTTTTGTYNSMRISGYSTSFNLECGQL